MPLMVCTHGRAINRRKGGLSAFNWVPLIAASLVWILATGIWSDGGDWDDSAVWID